ncbi:pre-mRNA-processing factor 39-like [Plakobranchus ocellatus]|uniref:Pre-mRNA-processing factor 39-like n=1 Tax=Plakobranchus ocellatus TaxID=259542 RepID=A0AAV4C7A0_9GAST|nr:pre-mRNA-processing factor 39-like [Plakobranchus ocellatus]
MRHSVISLPIPLQTNEKIFLQLLDVEYQAQPIEEDRVMEVFARLLKSDVSMEFKLKVSQRRMEFLEDFGECIKRISEAYDEHQKLVKEANSKKRKPEKEKGVEEPPDKKGKTEGPNTSAPADYNPQATAPPPPVGPSFPPDPNYGHNPPAWSSAPGYGTVPGNYLAYPYPAYPPQYGYYGY